MHAQDERLFNFKDGVMEAFENTDTYAMELNMDSIDQMALMSKLIMDSTHSLTTLLSEEDYKTVETFFKDSLQQPLFLYSKMQPLFTSQLITMKNLGNQKDEALDLYLFNEAKKQGKQTIGLEKMEEQIAAFASIPYKKQADMLVEAVKEYGHESGMMDTDEMLKKYLSEDLDALLEMTTSSQEDPELAEIFNTIFLINRNHNMADRSVKYMKSGSTFIAVGAAHLPGDEGVIELLRQKGYVVEAK